MLRNKEIETLVKIEKLLYAHADRLFCEEGERNEEEGYTPRIDPKTGVSSDDLNDYWNIVEREIVKKKRNNERVNAWNKAHPEKHRQHNREYARRKAQKNIDKSNNA